MKTKIIITTLALISIISCRQYNVQENKEAETPKVLQEEDQSSLEFISKRGGDNLVNGLYKELVSKNQVLQELEDRREHLLKGKADSLQGFGNYNQKNESYYKAANDYVNSISDSLLKNRMRVLLAESLAHYHSNIVKHIEIIKTIDSQTRVLDNFYAIIEISKTLPVIEKYQKNRLPSSQSMEAFSKELNEAIQYENTVLLK